MPEKVYLVILVSMLATQISRLGPMFMSTRFQMSESFERWLKFIPVGVLTAMIVPEFFTKTDMGTQINMPYLISAITAFVIGMWKKNLLLTTAVGVACLALLRMVQ